MVKKVFYRIMALVAFISGLLICPGKSVALDNLVNVSMGLAAFVLLLLALYLWRKAEGRTLFEDWGK